MRLRAECTLFCNLQSRARTHAILVIACLCVCHVCLCMLYVNRLITCCHLIYFALFIIYVFLYVIGFFFWSINFEFVQITKAINCWLCSVNNSRLDGLSNKNPRRLQKSSTFTEDSLFKKNDDSPKDKDVFT
jgi:hypothetical protein